MLTPGQQKVLEFIQAEQRAKGLTPSTREIQEHFGFASQTSVMQYLATLERKGFFNGTRGRPARWSPPERRMRVVDIPIYGQIPAGMSTLAEENIEGHVALDLDSINASQSGAHFRPAGARRFHDRRAHSRWRHRDSGGSADGAKAAISWRL